MEVTGAQVVSVSADFAVKLSNEKKPLALAGLARIAKPVSERAAEHLQGLLKRSQRVRFVPEGKSYYVEYLAWVDKSGEVWLDGGEGLVVAKLAAVADEPFARREVYLQAAAKKKLQ